VWATIDLYKIEAMLKELVVVVVRAICVMADIFLSDEGMQSFVWGTLN
jgi:hypothetical protein